MKRLALLLVAGCSGGPSSYDDFRTQLAARSADYQIACGLHGASEKSTADPAPDVLAIVEANLGVKCRFVARRGGDCAASANACDVGLTCTAGVCSRPGC